MDHTQLKILITGGTGFVGSYLVRTLLKEGYQHIRITKKATSPTHLLTDQLDRIEIVESDINDILGMEQAIEGMDWVIHTAALVSFASKDLELLYKTNVGGTENVINLCLSKNVKKLCFISSVAALSRTKNEIMIDETHKWVPGKLNTEYAVSKYQAELQAWRGFQEGLDVVIINPSIILGAGNWLSGSSNLIRQVAKGLPFYPPGKTGVVDVRDVAAMAILSMESNISGERFICSGHSVSYNALFSSISKELNVSPPKKVLTPFLAGIAWRFFRVKSWLTGKRPTITRETMRTGFHSFSYNNAKSREQLGFTYRSLEKTIADTCKSYLLSKNAGLDHGIMDLE